MRGFFQFLKVFFKYVGYLENILCTAGLFATTFLAFFQVLNRYLFRFEILWLNDVALFTFIFFMFFAIPLTTRENSHTGVDAFVKKYFAKNSRGARKYGLFLKSIVLGTLIVFTVPVWEFASRSMKYPQYATLVRWFNMSWLIEALFLCVLLCLMHVGYEILCGFLSMYRKINAEEGGQQ